MTLQRLDELLTRGDAVGVMADAAFFQMRTNELRIERTVFKYQHARSGHVVAQASVTFIGWFFGRGGCGSFTTAQNTPISRMAAKKSLKATGFTTKAFTPSA